MPSPTSSQIHGKVFRPMRRHTLFLGVRGAYWARIFAVLAIGLAAFLALGTLTVTVEKPLSTADSLERLAELELVRDAVRKRDSLAETVGTDDLSKLDLTDAERALVAKAESMGISASATSEQLKALVPATETVEADRFDPIPRAVVCIVVPTVLAFAWHLDLKGWSLSSETRRIAQFARRQKFYVLEPRTSAEED